jgi:hypothetical protein
MLQYNPSISGSLNVTGSLIISNGMIGTVNGVDVQIFSSSINQVITGIQAATGSQEGRLTSIESFTSSTSARLNSIETISASNISRIGSLETISASNISRINSLETTSASVDTLNTAQNTRLTNLEIKTGSLATTGSNTFYGTQTFSGSLYIKENLIVQGSSSLQNITASALDIGTNRIILNVDNPSVRYAGISVYDSGSTSGTGSLFWDSVDNHWLYEHPADSGAPYNSAILISGPKNEGNLGEELELVNNYIVKAVGGDHISSSAIYDDGSIVAIKNTTHITGSLNIGATAYPSVNLYTTSGTNFGITNRYTDNRLSIDRIGTGELINILSNGNVGIGISTVVRLSGKVLSINDTSVNLQSSIELLRNGASSGEIFVNSDNMVIGSFESTIPLVFRTQNTERIRITSGGNIGIGITNPAYILDVNGAARFGSSTYKMLSISDAGGAGWATTGGASTSPQLYMFNTGTSAIVQTYINNTARLEVSNSGISVSGASTFGSSTTNGDVTIISNGGPFQIKGRTTYDRTFLALTWDINPDAGILVGNALKFNVNPTWGTNSGTTAMTILANGKVGIGETTPDNSYQGLTIKGADPSLRLKTTSSSGWVWTEYVNSSGTNNFSMGVNQTTPYFGIRAGAGMDNPQFRMDSSGKIGLNSIPSTNPQLTIGGSLRVGRSIYGWFQSGTNNWDGANFLHLKTNMSAGLGGNIDYTMSLFYARLYSYAGQIKEGHLGFHNWDGTFFAPTSTGNIWSSPYRSSDGFVVLVLSISSSSHVGVTVDWHQAFPYPFVDKIVTASVQSANSSGVY